MKIKSGVGRYRDYDMEKSRGDTVYSVVAVNSTPDGKVCGGVNNRCARLQYTDKHIRSLAEFAWVGGNSKQCYSMSKIKKTGSGRKILILF